jgi:hypothetical protein
MNSLILNLLKGLNFWSLAMLIYKTGGRDAVTRFFTIPEGVLAKTPTANLPGRMAALVEERDEVTEELIELLDACVDEDFVDPD